MESIVLVIHLMVALAIIAVVLLQRSEGGGLGVGTSGGMGGLATPRSTADILTRVTGILAGIFMVTSLLLAILSGNGQAPTSSILDATGASEVIAPISGADPEMTSEGNSVVEAVKEELAPVAPVSE